MRIELISEAERLPVLLSEVRDFLKISHPDEDAMIAGYIRAATGACENFIGRKLIAQKWQLILNDWGNSGEIQIPLSPVLAIDKMEYWNGTSFQEIAAGDYLLDNTSYQAKILPDATSQWPEPDRNVAGIQIVVSAGFGEGQNDVPHDIRLGILHWVAAAYEGAGFGDNQTLFMAEKLWQPYRRMVL
ncbi:MAG: phage head-tail connector protein [Emcibacter sp.]|nr:phage head-tail connector protein [Emcibacter sp.]